VEILTLKVEDETDAIINGELANIEDFPYYAFISYEGDLHCGGAFIERDLVLTAAHCITGSTFTVYPGITTIRDLKRSKGYKMKSAVPHSQYWQTFNTAYDIGLIRLKDKIELGDKAQLIETASEPPPQHEEATVVGFGAVKCAGEKRCHKYTRASKHLRSTQIEILGVTSNGIVVTQSRGNRSTCYGDSGGPITYDGKVVAVVSSGQYGDCTGFDTQGPVFTMLDWIEETKAEM
ncbi:Trypsin, partial [Oryctes borbonicus]